MVDDLLISNMFENYHIMIGLYLTRKMFVKYSQDCELVNVKMMVEQNVVRLNTK